MFKGKCVDCDAKDVVSSVDGNTRCVKHHRQQMNLRLVGTAVHQPEKAAGLLRAIFGKRS